MLGFAGAKNHAGRGLTLKMFDFSNSLYYFLFGFDGRNDAS